MVKPPLRTKSIGFKVSEEEYAQLETAAQTSGRTLGEWCRQMILGASDAAAHDPALVAPQNLALHEGIAWSNCTIALGLRSLALKLASGHVAPAKNAIRNPASTTSRPAMMPPAWAGL
jgi:hypothetical protein